MNRKDYAILGCVAAILVALVFVFSPSPYERGCKELLKTCDAEAINNIIILKNGTGNYSLGNICAAKGYVTTRACAVSCGCSDVTAESILSKEPPAAYTNNPVSEGAFIVRKIG